MFLCSLPPSHSQDKLLPPRIDRDSDETDSDESPKPAPLRFQHRVTRNSPTFSHSEDAQSDSSSDDQDEDSEADTSDEAIDISEGKARHTRRENGCSRWWRAMGRAIKRGFSGFWLMLKRWLRVIGHLASGRRMKR